MAKNISILEGRKARNFSGTKKLRTTLGNGTQDWIPEDEAGQYCDFDTLEVTENGTYYVQGCDGYDKVVVNVSDGRDRLIDKAIGRNGTYKPVDDNADGYKTVTVNVGGGAGGAGDYTFDVQNDQSLNIDSQKSKVAVVDGVAYTIDYGTKKLYKYDGSAWVAVSNGTYASSAFVLEHNGELYGVHEPYAFVPGYTALGRFNGSDIQPIPESVFPSPEQPMTRAEPDTVVSYNGKIYYLGLYANGATARQNEVWAWDGSVWTQVGRLPNGKSFSNGISYEGKIHLWNVSTKDHYSFDGSSWTKEANFPAGMSNDGQAVVFEVQGKKRIHVWNGNNNKHYSYNGEFWRPERSKYEYSMYSRIALFDRGNGEIETNQGCKFVPVTPQDNG